MQIVVLAEHGDDVGRLVLAHQAVVDEDAGQLVADRLVDQQRRNGTVDAARQRADDALVADLFADGSTAFSR